MRDYPCWRIDLVEVDNIAALALKDALEDKYGHPSEGMMSPLETRHGPSGWRYQCSLVRDERIREGLFISLGACPPEGGPPAMLFEFKFVEVRAKKARVKK